MRSGFWVGYRVGYGRGAGDPWVNWIGAQTDAAESDISRASCGFLLSDTDSSSAALSPR